MGGIPCKREISIFLNKNLHRIVYDNNNNKANAENRYSIVCRFSPIYWMRVGTVSRGCHAIDYRRVVLHLYVLVHDVINSISNCTTKSSIVHLK